MSGSTLTVFAEDAGDATEPSMASPDGELEAMSTEDLEEHLRKLAFV